MKGRSRAGHLDKRCRGVEGRSERLVTNQPGHDRGRSLRVAPPENSSSRCRETKAQPEPEINIGRPASDLLFDHTDRLEQHGKKEPIRDFCLVRSLLVGSIVTEK